MPALIDPHTGKPYARSVEVSPDLESRLQKIERRWYLRHVVSRPNYWGLMERWKSEDPRRKEIQSGERASNTDFDMIQTFDGNLSAEDVVLLIEKNAERTPRTKAEAEQQAEQRIEETRATNARVKEDRKNEFIEEQNVKGGKRSKHERELSVGATTANPISTSETPKHKRTDVAKGVEPDQRNEQAAAMAGDVPFPTNTLDFTALNDDSTGVRIDDSLPPLVPAEH